MKRFKIFRKEIKHLTLKQTDDVFRLCNTLAKSKCFSAKETEEYFTNGSQTLANFYINFIEDLPWFDYKKHARLVLFEISSYVSFLYDAEEWNEEIFVKKDRGY
jgi:hypothetical protein